MYLNSTPGPPRLIDWFTLLQSHTLGVGQRACEDHGFTWVSSGSSNLIYSIANCVWN